MDAHLGAFLGLLNKIKRQCTNLCYSENGSFINLKRNMLLKHIKYIYALFFSLFLSVSICSQDAWQSCLPSALDGVDLPVNIYINQLDIESDLDIDEHEVHELIGFRQGDFITKEQLKNAFFYLRQKNSFGDVFFKLIALDQGYNLSLKIEKQVIFGSLKVHAFMVGKDQYKSCYLMNVGDTFDKEKHRLSFNKIKEKFHHQGFFNAKINDALKFDTDLKMVHVDLYLQKGVQFSIGKVDFQIMSSENYAGDDVYEVKKELKKLFHRKFFKLKYSKDLLDKSIQRFKRFLNRCGFAQSHVRLEESIDYKTKKVNLNFVISFEKKKKFVFWGNHFFTPDDFLENILMYGKSSWHFPGTIMQDEIINMYKKKGFWQVQVSVKEDKRHMYCLIKEGPRAVIKDIIFKDNHHISPSDLKACFKDFIKTRFFDADLFEQGLQELRYIYGDKGFWNAAVVKEAFIPLGDGKRYICQLTLEEGPQKFLDKVKVAQHEELLKDSSFPYPQQGKKPIPFSRSIVYDQKNWLISYFHDLGHNKITLDYEINEHDEMCDLVWNVVLHEQQVRFGKTILEGNSNILFKHIKKELAYQEGDLWSKEKLEESLQRFKDLDLFEEVYIYPYKHVDELGYNPVGLKLTLAEKYELRTRVGLQQVGRDLSFYDGVSYKFGSTFVVNNPLKFGDKFLLEADFTRFYGNLSAQYMIPWLFNRPVRSSLKVYNNSYSHPLYVGSNLSLYSALTQGVLISFNEKKKYLSYGVNLGLEVSRVKDLDIDGFATSIDYDQGLVDKKIPYVFIEPNVLWSRLDSLMNPTKGFRSLISMKIMGDLQSKTSFFKVMGEHSFYTPIKKSVLAVRLRIGHIFNRLFEQISPLDRFYLGGANSVRGYIQDYCPPFGELQDPISVDRGGLTDAAKGYWKYVPQGGRTMINANVEVRVPIYQDLSGVLFSDIGGLIKDSLFDAQAAVVGGSGFGFRYNTPIGPLRIDLAWKWRKEKNDFQGIFAWYLSLGHAF